MTYVLLSALVLFAIFVLTRELSGGSLVSQTSIQIKGSTAPQGTATSSSLTAINTTISGNSQESLSYGTASGQVNVIVAQDRTLAASSSETLNLNSGALLDIFGAAAAMAHLKFIAVYVVSGGDVNGLTVESGASNPFAGYGINSTGTIVYPNGPGLHAGEPTAGIACGSSACTVKLVNNSSAVSVTYRLIVAGTTT